MSRNKFIILIATCIVVYYAIPNTGQWADVKANIINLLPYLLIGVIIYLVITINILKKRWRDCTAEPSDANVQQFAKMLNITFDVKRMLGADNMINLYKEINASKIPSMKTKRLLYEAYRKKRLDVPPPSQGLEIDKILNKSGKSKEELKAEAAERRRKREKMQKAKKAKRLK